MVELSCYVREMSHCPRDGVRKQISYSIITTSLELSTIIISQKKNCYFDLYFSPELQLLTWFYGMSLVTASYEQYSSNTETTTYATRVGSLLRRQTSAICSKRALFPYNDSCHVNFSAHKLSVPKAAFVATSIAAVHQFAQPLKNLAE